MFVNLEICEQSWNLSSKILRKIGQKKELLERKIGGKKKQNRLIPTLYRIPCFTTFDQHS